MQAPSAFTFPDPAASPAPYSFEDIHMSLDNYEKPSLPKKKGRKKRADLEASGIFVPVTQRSTKGIYREGAQKTAGGRDDPLIIYKNVDGMCVPLLSPLNEIDLKNLSDVNFFPYVDKHYMEYGFMFKEPDGTYRKLPQQKWRAILHGKTNQLRPKNAMPFNNRVSVTDSIAGEVTICYWPDKYYEKYKKSYSTYRNLSSTKKKLITDENKENPTIDDQFNQSQNQAQSAQKGDVTNIINNNLDASVVNPRDCVIKGPRHNSEEAYHNIATYLLNRSSFLVYQ
jgi:hypothetical protein